VCLIISLILFDYFHLGGLSPGAVVGEIRLTAWRDCGRFGVTIGKQA
jgi:hypothetical protein